MTKIDELKPGQIFKAEGGVVWKLENFAPVITAIPHVRLVDVGDRTAYKIIAASTLLDPKRFSSVESAHST